MNATDRIITALTPGTIFNKTGSVYRSLGSLAKFAGLSEDDTVALLSGDMVDLVTCKPAKDQQTILVALIAIADAALPAALEEAGEDAVEEPPAAKGLNPAQEFGPGYHAAQEEDVVAAELPEAAQAQDDDPVIAVGVQQLLVKVGGGQIQHVAVGAEMEGIDKLVIGNDVGDHIVFEIDQEGEKVE